VAIFSDVSILSTLIWSSILSATQRHRREQVGIAYMATFYFVMLITERASFLASADGTLTCAVYSVLVVG